MKVHFHPCLPALTGRVCNAYFWVLKQSQTFPGLLQKHSSNDREYLPMSGQWVRRGEGGAQNRGTLVTRGEVEQSLGGAGGQIQHWPHTLPHTVIMALVPVTKANSRAQERGQPCCLQAAHIPMCCIPLGCAPPCVCGQGVSMLFHRLIHPWFLQGLNDHLGT